jgi:hypothetical protein
MFLWLPLSLAGILAFGFLWATPVLVFAFLRLSEREAWAVAATGALGTWLVLYLVFVEMLELFLFEGRSRSGSRISSAAWSVPALPRARLRAMLAHLSIEPLASGGSNVLAVFR